MTGSPVYQGLIGIEVEAVVRGGRPAIRLAFGPRLREGDPAPPIDGRQTFIPLDHVEALCTALRAAAAEAASLARKAGS
jgi:hypothetical protein